MSKKVCITFSVILFIILAALMYCEATHPAGGPAMLKTDKAGLLMGMVEFENSKQEALRIDILKDIGRHPGE